MTVKGSVQRYLEGILLLAHVHGLVVQLLQVLIRYRALAHVGVVVEASL